MRKTVDLNGKIVTIDVYKGKGKRTYTWYKGKGRLVIGGKVFI